MNINEAEPETKAQMNRANARRNGQPIPGYTNKQLWEFAGHVYWKDPELWKMKFAGDTEAETVQDILAAFEMNDDE